MIESRTGKSVIDHLDFGNNPLVRLGCRVGDSEDVYIGELNQQQHVKIDGRGIHIYKSGRFRIGRWKNGYDWSTGAYVEVWNDRNGWFEIGGRYRSTDAAEKGCVLF